MNEASLGTPPVALPPDDRLDSWKEIAAYSNATSPPFSAGKTRGDAGPAPCARQAGVRLRVSVGTRRLVARPQSAGALEVTRRRISPGDAESPLRRRAKEARRSRSTAVALSFSRAILVCPCRDRVAPRGRDDLWRNPLDNASFRTSPILAARKPRRSHAMAGSWRSCPIAMVRWTSGSRR